MALAGSYLTVHRCCAATCCARAGMIPSLPSRVAVRHLVRGAAVFFSSRRLPMTDIRRAVLWVVLTMSLLMLWDGWQKHNGQPSLFSPSKPAATAPSATGLRLGRRACARCSGLPAAGAASAVPAAVPSGVANLVIETDVARQHRPLVGDGAPNRRHYLQHLHAGSPASCCKPWVCRRSRTSSPGHRAVRRRRESTAPKLAWSAPIKTADAPHAVCRRVRTACSGTAPTS